MKKTIRFVASTLMIVLILASIVWYLFIYDPMFTRDTLLQQARFHDMHGNPKISAFFYDLAYVFSDQDEDVAIELANQYKADGNYTKAEYTLTFALKNNPTADLYIALCRVFVEQDKLLDAVNLLDNIGYPDVKQELDSMRPSIPTVSKESGYYSQYIDVELSSSGKYIFYTTDGVYPTTAGNCYQNPITLPAGETLIYAVAVSENGLVSPLATFSYTITGVIEPVTFTDPIMEAHLRQLVGAREDSVVMSNQLWEITELTVPEGVTTLADLKLLPYLQTLTINGLTIDSLTHLSGLESLTTLNLSGSSFNVDELNVLATLPALTNLNLSGCSLSTIAGLAGAPGLTHLDLSSNTIRNLEVLGAMTTLVELNLSNNAVADLTHLGTLTNLSTLKVNSNALTSLKPLASCVKLAHLEADDNEITAVSGVEHLPLLTHLSVDYNQITDVTLLNGCVDLVNLSIASNDITDISSLFTLTKLEIFDFSGNHVEALPEWPEGCQLRTIDGSYNALTSIDVLSKMQHLTHVYMDYNLLTNIDALADNFCLVQVNVFGNAIADVSALRDHDIIVNYDPTLAAKADDDE
ncbi:MAG: chitobiase/beta-hexosaminidase C-terminal domain-containing protein [Oscillospiraceae bacterium]|nr:chitobiase/beta-hexosaminidase C-terminal domain-containing protein [Oscillospiraceae bacterium]